MDNVCRIHVYQIKDKVFLGAIKGHHEYAVDLGCYWSVRGVSLLIYVDGWRVW